MELFSEIKAIIAKLLAVDAEAITKEAHLNFDLGADSLALVNLANAISEKYGIELLDGDLVELDNVGQLISLVESRINT
jgi:acyl carrier protein